MEKRTAVLAIAMALGLGLTTGCQGPPGVREGDYTAIRRGSEMYAQFFRAHDWRGLAGMYTDDAIYLPSNEPAIQGRAAILAWMEKWPAYSNYQQKTLEIDGNGDMIYERGVYTVIVTYPGAEPFEEKGKYVSIWRKQPDGSWKIWRDLENSDLPLPPH
jgi:ketosteroid isomerase-like protein